MINPRWNRQSILPPRMGVSLFDGLCEALDARALVIGPPHQPQ
jgi:hypothetical protein